MKLSSAVQLSLIISVALGTACGAAPTQHGDSVGTTSSGSSVIMTPELQNADARVQQAEKQLDLAKKQLKAAQSILKAADADLKAAKAERQAIALRTQAQGMAQEAGMTPAGNRALAEADSAAVTAGRNANANQVLPQTAPPANVSPDAQGTASVPSAITNTQSSAAPAVRTQELPYTPTPAPNSDGTDAVAPELR